MVDGPCPHPGSPCEAPSLWFFREDGLQFHTQFWVLTFLYELSMLLTLGDQLFSQLTSQPFPKAQVSPRSTGLGLFPKTLISKTHLLPLSNQVNTDWGRWGLLKPIQNTMFWLYPFLRSVDRTNHLLHNQGEPLKWKKISTELQRAVSW